MSEVRDLGFLAWKDPDAWMEKMRGPQWEALVNEENQRLQQVLRGKDELIARFKNELAEAAKIYDWEIFGDTMIHVTPLSAFSIKWRFDGESSYTFARDLATDIGNTVIAYTHDIGKGSELFELVVQNINTRKILWRRAPVGPTVSIQDDKVYYLGVSQKLWYNKLLSCALLTGANIQEKYDEKNAHYNLSLERRITQESILVRENAGKTDTFIIYENKITQVAPGSEKQLIISNGYYYYRNKNEDNYNPSEHISSSDFEGTPVSTNGLFKIITRQNGESRIYDLEEFNNGGNIETMYAELLHIKQGTILFSSFNDYGILIDDGTAPPYYLDVRNRKKQSPHKGAFKLKAHKIKAVSADGTEIYGTLLHNANITRPKALFAVGYGAYGVPSSPAGAYAKWTPLLKREWGVLYTYIRGGGDHTDGWAQAGRLEGRKHTCDDFLALVEAAQKQFTVPATKTVIYGRSAGGFLMGMCLNKEPTGRLFGAVYTEVPYVDLLRTTTNPALPLTKMEYNEFGDPAHRAEDFGFLVDMSPADVAITTEAPNVFVLARTGLNDSQVYAYEPVKWIRRLRKPGDKEEKVIGIARGEGHFYSGDTALEAKAEDLAILHSRIFPNTTSA